MSERVNLRLGLLLLFVACSAPVAGDADSGAETGGTGGETGTGGGSIATGGGAGGGGGGGGGESGTGGGSTALGGGTATGGGLATGGGAGGGGTIAVDAGIPFSFFVTSLAALQALSGSAVGFGGDLRYGETGPGAGLRGADKLCAAIAERSLPGSSSKQWRAFLSADLGEDGGVVNAIDRVGDGPWYDRLGRVVSLQKLDLLSTRPLSAAAAIKNDLPNEDGVPNHRPDVTQPAVDNHDTLTGSNSQGTRYTNSGLISSNCLSWTSASPDVTIAGRPRVGHSWPRGSTGGPAHWINSLDEAGCAPGVNLIESGPPVPDAGTVGSGGGYGGFYCFALTP